jgi:hypothetical protein
MELELELELHGSWEPIELWVKAGQGSRTIGPSHNM